MAGSRERSDRRRKSRSRSRHGDRSEREQPQKERDRRDRGQRKSKFDTGTTSAGKNDNEAGHYGPGPVGGAKSSGFSSGGNRFSLGAGGQTNPENGSEPIIPTNYDLPSRKIYVGGIGQHHSENEVAQFLGNTLQRAKACLEPGNPVIKTQINRDKRYLFVELRTAEEASALIQLDGIDFQNYPLRIRRCQEYNVATAPPLKRPVPVIDTVELGIVSTQVQETPNKVFIGGIPRDWDEEKIKQLLVQSAGKLRSFHLVRDSKDQSSKGYAFCEFASLDGVQMAMQSVHGMQILDQTPGMLGGTKTLNVRRTGKYQNQAIDGSILASNPINPNQRQPQGGLMNLSVPAGPQMNTQYKSVFEDNISEYIKNMNVFSLNAQKIEGILANTASEEQLREQIAINNGQIKDYFNTSYNYKFCTNYIKISVSAFDGNPELKEKYFGNENYQGQNESKDHYEEFKADIMYELSKFGEIDNIKIPKLHEVQNKDDVGQVYVNFINIASAFICYNLLNNKPYLGKPVEIKFINEF